MAKADEVTDDERQKRRLRAVRNRTYRALEELGVDVRTLAADDRAAVRQAEDNVRKLREIGSRMRRPAVGPTAPTRERVAHAPRPPRAIEVRPDAPRAHHFAWIVDTVRDRLSDRQYEAARRLLELHEAMQPRSAVADTTGAGGPSDPSRRLPITEHQELAAREFHWVLGRLEAAFHRVVRPIVLEIVPIGAERLPTIVEIGREVSGFSCEKRAMGAGTTALVMSCARLAALFAAWDDWQREQCAATDRLMRTELGRRAGAQGWIVALWMWAHRKRRLPTTQGEVDAVRAAHDAHARFLRTASPLEVDRHHRRRDRLTGLAFREDESGRVRVA